MTLQELKTRLPLRAVLAHYGLTPDKNNRLRCPWHDDKTPSLQLYFRTNSWTCFSAACEAGSGDAIEFCCRMEGDKGKGIAVAKKIAGMSPPANWRPSATTPIKEPERKALFSRAWLEARAAYERSGRAQEYARDRSISEAEIGFVSTRFGSKWKAAEKALGRATGLLTLTYDPMWKGCLLFALRDKTGEITSFYARKVEGYSNAVKGRHYYLPGKRAGIYPRWAGPGCKQLILCESVIDAASLPTTSLPEQSPETSIIALYGTNGLNDQHSEMISGLTELEEIVLMFDGDKAGEAATEKYSKQLAELRPDVRISAVDLPEGEDVNSMAVGHEAAVFGELLQERKVLRSPEIAVDGEKSELESESEKLVPVASALDTSDPERLVFQTESMRITIWGGIDAQVMSRLKVNLQLKQKGSYGSYREDVNLYSHRQTKALINDASEALEIPSSSLQAAIYELTEALELYRLEQREQERIAQMPKRIDLNPAQTAAAMKLLKSPELVKQTIQLISQSGLVGERKNGLLLFFVYLTRMSEEPLHAIIQGKSGSGKTYLQSKIGGLIPEESVQMVTGLTENTLYYAPKHYFRHKVLIIEDLDGTYAALYPLREFMSKGSLTKLTTDKDAKGNNVQRRLHVEGPVCVSGATTSAQIYEDNANRSYLLEVDESRSHAEAVMHYQRRDKAGQIDRVSQNAAREALKNGQRLLKSVKVINPYATALRIPKAVFKPLRTNMHYLRLIEAITFYHQHQRRWHKDKNGQLYIKTSLEDIAWANWLVKESLLRKADELNGRLRQFFERLKNYLEGSTGSFFAKDIRQGLRIHPQSLHRNLKNLERLGLVQQIGYNRKTGFEYEIIIWDDYEKLKDGINILDKILQELRDKEKGNKGGENDDNQEAA